MGGPGGNFGKYFELENLSLSSQNESVVYGGQNWWLRFNVTNTGKLLETVSVHEVDENQQIWPLSANNTQVVVPRAPSCSIHSNR